MKSQIFKNAWVIFRINKVSFSESLKTAWQAFKIKAELCISYSDFKKQIPSCVVFKIRKGTSTYHRQKLSDLIEDLATHRDNDSSGAVWDYGRGIYNGD
jgi:hypothetical protein